MLPGGVRRLLNNENYPDKKNGPLRARKIPDEVMRRIAEAVSELEYGRVIITVQDGKVVQIEKTQKIRLT